MARGKGTKKASIEETGESVKETAGPPAKKKKTDTTGSQNTKRVDLVKVAIEHCTSWQKFKRMAKEYLEYFMDIFTNIETETNTSKPRRGAFNIR